MSETDEQQRCKYCREPFLDFMQEVSMKRRHISSQEAWDIYELGKSSNYVSVVIQEKNANIFGYGANKLIVESQDGNFFSLDVNIGVNFGENTTIPTDSYKGNDNLVTLYPVKKRVKKITIYE